MKRWQRIVLRRAASALASVAYDCEAMACRLRGAANRKPPRPLCFPTAYEVTMSHLMDHMGGLIAERSLASILHGNSLFRVAADGDDIQLVKVKDAYRD